MRAWLLVLLLLAVPAAAQHQHHQAPASPYAGMQDRPIKALSEQQIADLKAGRGMGLALAAELNGYPGPVHVLELGDRLGLTPDQRAQTVALVAAMQAEAKPLGEDIIAREAKLDRSFAERTIDADGLRQQLAELGARQAELRHAHLKYHLAMLQVLTPEQVARYRELRGYASK